MNNFDTQPLLSEINNIIKNGVQEIVKDFMKRHDVLEETHDKLVNLPSVKQYYKCVKSKDDSIEEIRHEIRIKKEPEPESLREVQDNVKEDVSKLIQNLDEKMNNIWNIHGEYFVKLSNQLDELKNEIDVLKCENKQLSTFSNSNLEKENIKLEIVDDTQIEEEVVEELEVEEEEEEEEVEEEEEEVEEEEEEEEEVESVETETKDTIVDVDEEEEEELFEIEIDDVTYCTNNEENGMIYELDKEGNVGNKVGYLKEGEAYFD
jgi:hypothetical protein